MKVEYVDHMGDDLLIANAARRSFGTEYTEFSETPRTERGRSDRELIMDLAKDGHMLPFRHAKLSLSCDAAIPVARQLSKHQVGFDWSEISRRYKTKDIAFESLDWAWRSDVKDRRQGSGGLMPLTEQQKLAEVQKRNIDNCIEDYELALELGASPEQARFLLPQSMIVEWTWTGSLLGWSHLFNQRNHPDTQKETRDFAGHVSVICAKYFPVAWEALARKADWFM